MEQSGVVGLTIEGQAEQIISFREAPFCTQYVLAEMMGVEKITKKEKGTDLFLASALTPNRRNHLTLEAFPPTA